MRRFRKADLFAFAEFHYRYASRGLTMDELLVNFLEHKRNPRLVEKEVKITEDMETQIIDDVVIRAAEAWDVDIQDIHAGKKSRPVAYARQMTAYISLKLGFTPSQIVEHLSWDRSSVYARDKACQSLAFSAADYRKKLNALCEIFGLPVITKYI